MKKFICFLCLLSVCFSLCACDPGSFIVTVEDLDGVVSIELIEYNNSNQKEFNSWVPNHFNKLKPFKPENATVIEELQEDKEQDFLDAFMQTDILHTYYVYDSPKDVCIRLNYANGNFLIIWANYKEQSYSGYIGEYSSDGTVVSFWGCFSNLIYYQDLVNNYFEYNV